MEGGREGGEKARWWVEERAVGCRTKLRDAEEAHGGGRTAASPALQEQRRDDHVHNQRDHYYNEIKTVPLVAPIARPGQGDDLHEAF